MRTKIWLSLRLVLDDEVEIDICFHVVASVVEVGNRSYKVQQQQTESLFVIHLVEVNISRWYRLVSALKSAILLLSIRPGLGCLGLLNELQPHCLKAVRKCR